MVLYHIELSKYKGKGNHPSLSGTKRKEKNVLLNKFALKGLIIICGKLNENFP